MALVKCKECGEQISSKAKSCPKCGSVKKKKTSFLKWVFLIILVVGVYNIANQEHTTNSLTQKATPQKATSLAEKYPIEALSPQQLERVKLVLLDVTPEAKILKTAAVKSQTHQRAYYVGAKFTAPGINEPLTGVWFMTGAKEKPGLVHSVNDLAYEFSKMGMANTTLSKASIADDEYKILEKYLR